MQSRDSMSLTDRESSSDESDCSPCKALHQGLRESVSGTQNAGRETCCQAEQRRRRKGGRHPQRYRDHEEGNEVVTSVTQTAATVEQTPAESPSKRKSEMLEVKPQPMGKARRQEIGQPVFCDHP